MENSIAEICIVGLGPAGLGAALRLADSPMAQSTLCFEAGVPVEEKFCSILRGSPCRRVEPCQMISGVGGSSVLSGGKVSDFPAGRAMEPFTGGQLQLKECLSSALAIFSRYVPLDFEPVSPALAQKCLQNYASVGFEFRYYPAYRYRQADLLRGYSRMIERIVNAGISVHLHTKVTQIIRENNCFVVTTRTGSGVHTHRCRRVLIAGGRLAGNLLQSLNGALDLGGGTRPFDVGVRLEFPTEIWPDIDECHKDLKLHFGNARTFCVCKDGWIAPYRIDGIFLTEGHSEPGSSTGMTNLAVTLREKPSTDFQIFDAIRQQLKTSSYTRPVRQRFQDFLENRTSVKPFDYDSSISFWSSGNLNDCFPDRLSETVRGAVSYFASRLIPKPSWSRVTVFGPELDQYWSRYPLRLGFQTNTPDLFIIGDASGHFRGILQAFCSGLTCANMLSEARHE